MTNAEIASIFEQVADLLEFQGANAFRVRAYRNAAGAIRTLTEQVARIAADPNRKLTDIAGIGKDLANSILTLLATHKLPLLGGATGARFRTAPWRCCESPAWDQKRPRCSSMS